MIVKMPQVGMTMLMGTVVNWMKNDGDMVSEGEPLFEFETEKMTNVVPSPATGKLRIIAQVDTDVDCGEPVAEIVEE
jgi:pyruvate dehydrogenase E2 component (dihydrolipoamide acetyltransferase)